MSIGTEGTQGGEVNLLVGVSVKSTCLSLGKYLIGMLAVKDLNVFMPQCLSILTECSRKEEAVCFDTGENVWPCGQTERRCVIPGVDFVGEMNSACQCRVPFSFSVHRRLNNFVFGWHLGKGSN